jgi:hypothetical protein
VIAHKNVLFDVRRNGVKFGRLEVSRGALVWRPANKKKGYRLSWEKLNELASDKGRRGHYPV